MSDDADATFPSQPLLEEGKDELNFTDPPPRKSGLAAKVCQIVSIVVLMAIFLGLTVKPYWDQVRTTPTGPEPVAEQKTIDLSQPPRYLFTFGDSYTSTEFQPWLTLPTPENPFGNPPYPGITTSGGSNWVGKVVHDLTPPTPLLVYNFAARGAAVDHSITENPVSPFSFKVQTDLFGDTLGVAGTTWTGDNSAVVVWFGQNDLILTWEKQNYATTIAPIFDSILTTYFAQVDRLLFAGVRKFVLIELETTVSRTPMFSAADDVLRSLIASDTAIWNAELRNRAVMFRAAHPDVSVVTLNVTSAFADVLNNPGQFHVSTDTICSNEDGTSCVWFDYFHPGQAIQGQLAKTIHESLKTVGFVS